MKWLISSCILIAFSVGIICIESEEDDCIEQLRNQTRLVESCIGRSLSNSTEYSAELTSTLFQYSGNDAAVEAFTNKYCPILRRVFECSNIGHDVDVECLYPLAKEIDQQNYDLKMAVLNYACANNAEVILRVLQHSGLDTIYLSKPFDECVGLVRGVRYKVDEKTLGPTTELCDGVDRVFACYTNYTREHANKDLAIIGNELRTVFRLAYKC